MVVFDLLEALQNFGGKKLADKFVHAALI